MAGIWISIRQLEEEEERWTGQNSFRLKSELNPLDVNAAVVASAALLEYVCCLPFSLDGGKIVCTKRSGTGDAMQSCLFHFHTGLSSVRSTLMLGDDSGE